MYVIIYTVFYVQNRFENLQQGKKKFNSDGLVSLKYAVAESRANLLYTWFLVNLRKPS